MADMLFSRMLHRESVSSSGCCLGTKPRAAKPARGRSPGAAGTGITNALAMRGPLRVLLQEPRAGDTWLLDRNRNALNAWPRYFGSAIGSSKPSLNSFGEVCADFC